MGYTRRWFKPGVLYCDLDWTRLAAIADAFAERLDEWYIKPAEALKVSGHFAFAAMALNCILIDTLSQFYSGSLFSTATTFKEFVRQVLPDFAKPLSVPIQHFDVRNNKTSSLTDFADVLYHAFRCGIVHEAHVTPYGMILGGTEVVFLVPSGHVKYTVDWTDCPSVIIEPWVLLDKVKTVLAAYIRNLKNPDPTFGDLRSHFKKKFADSFGVDVSGSV